MLTHGTVIKKFGNVSKIKIGAKEGCSSCGKCRKYRDKVVSALDDTSSNVGDEVRVEIDDVKYRQSIILLYIIPLFAFIFGVFIGYYVLSSGLSENLVDIISVICGIICLFVAYFAIWLLRNKIDKSFVAKVVTILKS